MINYENQTDSQQQLHVYYNSFVTGPNDDTNLRNSFVSTYWQWHKN